MPFPYTHILIIGATSGIGLALATRLAETGIKITAVGRRQDRLDDFVQKHNHNHKQHDQSQHAEPKIRGVQFDISHRKDIPGFVSTLMSESPDIDCVFLNAGFQRQEDFTCPEEVDMGGFHEQMNVNFSGVVDLVYAFLPYFSGRNGPTGFIFTTSNLAIIPAVKMPAYSASKAALSAFILCLREQLQSQNSKVNVIELSPPAVQTELHDYMTPEIGRNVGMPLDAFTDEAFQRLMTGEEDHIVVGSIGPEEMFREVVGKRREVFTGLSKMMLGGL